MVAKSDGRPAVEVENGGQKQRFVSIVLSLCICRPNSFCIQSAEELSSMVLSKMRETAQQYLNKNVK